VVAVKQLGFLRRIREESRAIDHSERGDTLIEVLLAVVVLGLASVALLIAFSTSISASAEHRRLATANISLGSVSQQAIAEIESQITLFTICHPLSYYQNSANIPLNQPVGSSWSAAITDVQYWSASTSSFSHTCFPGVPQNIQITVTDNTGFTYSNNFVVDYPLANSVTSAPAGAATQFVIVTQPSASGNSAGLPLVTQPIFQIEDASGNVAATDLSPVSLSIKPGTGATGAVLSGCSATESLGVITFSGCTINLAGTGYQLVATDGGFATTVTTSLFNVGGTSAPNLVFTTQPVGGASGSQFSTEPVIKVYLNGSVDAAWSGSVNLKTSGGLLSSNCATITIANGVSSPTPLACSFQGGYLYDPISQATLAVPYTVAASGSGLIPTNSSAFTVSSSGAASKLIFTTQATGVASGSSSTPFNVQPAVTVEDAFGNVVTSYATSITLAISAGETLGGCSSVTPVKGVAAFSACHASSYATGVTLTASSGALPSVTSASFNITGAPYSLAFTTQPVAGVSGSTLTTEPVITIYDSVGRVVTASTGAISLTSSSNGVLQLCSNLTPVNGVVTVSTCTFAGIVGTPFTLTAQQGALTIMSASFSPTDPGAPTQLAFTTQPVAGASLSVMTTQPVVKVEDSAGNVVTTSPGAISLVSSAGSLASCTNLVPITGVVIVAGCTFGGVVGTSYNMTASSGGLTSNTSSGFSPSSSGPATQIVLSGCSGNLTWSSTCTATAVVKDSFANTVTAYSSGVTFATAGGTGAVGGLGIVAAQNGIANIVLTGTTLGTVPITATATSLTSNTVTTTVIPAAQSVAFFTSASYITQTSSGTTTFSPSGTYQLFAKGSSSGTMTFASTTTVICTVGSTSGLVTIVAAGVCNLTSDAAAIGNYADSGTTPFALTIGQAANSITITSTAPSAATYSGATYRPTATATSGDAVVITSSSTSVCAVSGGVVSFVGVGSCTLNFNDLGNSNYLSAAQLVQTFVVAKSTQAPLTITSTVGTYGTPIALIASGGSGTGAVTFVAANGTATGCTVLGSGQYTLSSSDVGTCLVTATKATDANYLAISSAPTTVTINRASLTLSAVNQNLVFTSSAAIADTTSIAGLQGTDTATVTSAIYTYAGISGTTYGPSTTAPTNVGAYSVAPSSATINFTSGSASNYVTSFTYTGGTLTISKAPLTVTAANQSLPFTASPALVDSSNVTGFVGTDAATVTSAMYTYNGTGATTYGPSTTAPTNVGTYSTAPSAATLNFTVGSPSNYVTPFTYVAGTLTITPVQLTVTASTQNLTFTAQPAVADISVASGFKGTNAASVASVTSTYNGTGATSYGPSTTAPTNVGTYSVTPSAATLTFSSGIAANYLPTFAYIAGSLTITSASLTVTATSQNLTWTASPAVADTSILSGVPLPDAASVASATYTYNGTGATTYGPSITAPTNVGTYSVTPSAATLTFASGNASNYSTTLTYVAGTLTINRALQAALSITTINGGNHSTGYLLNTTGGSGTGAVTYSATNGSANSCSVSGSTLTANKGGTCIVTATKAADSNYSATSSVATTVTLAS
jgi:type II secretory pathway pseudopilin PulG